MSSGLAPLTLTSPPVMAAAPRYVAHTILSDITRCSQPLSSFTPEIVMVLASWLYFVLKISDLFASNPELQCLSSQSCKDKTTCSGNYTVGLLKVSVPTVQCLPPGKTRRKTETFHSFRPALALQYWQRWPFVSCHWSRSAWQRAHMGRGSVWIDSHLFSYIHSLNSVSSEHVMFQRQNDISVHLLRDD